MQRQQRRRPEAHAAAHGRCGDHIPFHAINADARFLFSVLRAGFLEICGESNYILEQSGQKHYMKGGKPGFYPSIRPVSSSGRPLTGFSRQATVGRPITGQEAVRTATAHGQEEGPAPRRWRDPEDGA